MKIFSLIIILVLFLSACDIDDLPDNEYSGNPSLYHEYIEHFPIGAAVAVSDWANTLDSHRDLIEKHFISVTAENSMKPNAIQPQEGNFNFSMGDRLVDFAEDNDMLVRGHTLVWHAQTPSWFFEDENGQPIVELDEDGMVVSENDNISEEDRQLVIKRMENHIEKVMSYYGDNVYVWDVVNEAVTDDWESGDIHRQDSPWYTIVGEEFVKLAFEKAHEVAPEAKLFYNDYNAVMGYKRGRIIDLLEELINDDVHIDGVGIQAHWGVDEPSIEEIEQSIQEYVDLGLEIHITELDVGMEGSTEEEQAQRYKEIFEVFIKHSEDIANVTLWGVADDATWREGEDPLLFDNDHEPKDAFWKLIKLTNEE